MTTRIPYRDEWSPRPEGWDAERTFDVRPPKCKRHKWEWTEWVTDESRVLGWFEWCVRCHTFRRVRGSGAASSSISPSLRAATGKESQP